MKEQLRRELFEMIKGEEGTSVKYLSESIDEIINVWDKLQELITLNIADYNGYSKVKQIAEYNQYLIINLGIMHYIIIDRNRVKCVSKTGLDKSFFIDLFEEVKWGETSDYKLDRFKGDIPELLDFIENNREILLGSTCIKKEVETNNHRGYLSINLKTGSKQLGFYSKNFSNVEYLIINRDDTIETVKERNKKVSEDLLLYYEEIKDCLIEDELVPKYLREKVKNKALKNIC